MIVPCRKDSRKVFVRATNSTCSRTRCQPTNKLLGVSTFRLLLVAMMSVVLLSRGGVGFRQSGRPIVAAGFMLPTDGMVSPSRKGRDRKRRYHFGAVTKQAAAFDRTRQQTLVLHGPPEFTFSNDKAQKTATRVRPFKLVIVESPSKCHTIAKILQKYVEENNLDHDYVVTSCVGHIRDIPTKKTNNNQTIAGIELEQGYRPIYVLLPQKTRLISDLRGLTRQAQQLILATDDDREGEAMAWHLLEVLSSDYVDHSGEYHRTLQFELPPLRVRFSEITHKAILKSMEDPATSLRDNLVQAQETRRILDRIAGYTVSPLLWKKISPGLSAGRVQSVGMSLIVQRERERLLFQVTDYWDLEGKFSLTEEAGLESFSANLVSLNGMSLAASGADFESRQSNVLTESSRHKLHLREDAARVLVAQIKEQPGHWEWTVANVTSTTRKMNPPPPFTTSTLQQEANKRLALPVSRTMQAAQKLYETGFITYMRTDSDHLSEDALQAVRSEIIDYYGEEKYEARKSSKQKRSKTKKGDKKPDPPAAHEAIRPVIQANNKFTTPTDYTSSNLSGVEAKLYRLIYQRTVAAYMSPQVSNQTSVLVLGENDDTTVTFRTSGSIVVDPGFTIVDPKAQSTSSALPCPISEGQRLACDNVTALGHKTQPPARYTEASFVRELEALGIGRPSTYSSIVQTLRDRAYVGSPTSNSSRPTRGSSKLVSGPAISAQRAAGGIEFTGAQNARGPLVPSLSAFVVCSLLEDHCPDYVDPSFTSRMEDRLDQIANSEYYVSQNERVAYLDEFYSGDNGLKAQIQRLDKSVSNNEARRVKLPALLRNASLPERNNLKDDIQLFVGPWGPYVQKISPEELAEPYENRKTVSASLPPSMAADLSTITLQTLSVVLSTREGNGLTLGTHPRGGIIRLKTGKFGPYLEYDGPEGTTTHSLPRGKGVPLDPNSANVGDVQNTPSSMLGLSLEEAVQYVNLPRQVGVLGELPISAAIGPYGPYLKYNNTYMSLAENDGDVISIDYETAATLVTERIVNKSSKLGRGVLAEIGEMQGSMITVKSGHFGNYINWKRINAQIPSKYVDCPSELPLEEAWSSIQAKTGGASLKVGRSKKGKKSRTSTNLTLPPAPKRPLSGYLHFCAAKRSEVEASSSLGAISKELAGLWATTSEKERAPYMALAEASKLKYEKEKIKWQTDCQEILDTSNKRSEKIKVATAKGSNKAPSKRPKSAYLYFCADKRPTVSKQFNGLREVSKELARLWSKISSSDREVYEAYAAADRLRYQREVSGESKVDTTSRRGKKTRNKTKKVASANKKGRSASAYMLFCAAHRNGVVDDNGQRLPFGETTKRLAQMWKDCNEETRAHFVAQAEKRKELVVNEVSFDEAE